MHILWISRNAPYDSVAHAGGKIHNYLLKKFHKLSGDCFLISFINEKDFHKIDLNLYNIPYDISLVSNKGSVSFYVKKLLGVLLYVTSLLGFDTAWYIWRIFRSSLKYKQKKINPDVVILQWTTVVNQIFWLKLL